jgi:hypothetical protein
MLCHIDGLDSADFFEPLLIFSFLFTHTISPAENKEPHKKNQTFQQQQAAVFVA